MATTSRQDAAGPAGRGLKALLEEIERDLILAALRDARGNKAKAARALGLTERLMGIRVRKLGIDWRRFRHPPGD
jgi:Nif-specific regulatory protein